MGLVVQRGVEMGEWTPGSASATLNMTGYSRDQLEASRHRERWKGTWRRLNMSNCADRLLFDKRGSRGYLLTSMLASDILIFDNGFDKLHYQKQ